jgi:hypothetical protein
VRLPVRDRDVLVTEESGLATFPPVHSTIPLVGIEFLAVEFVAHWLEVDPPHFVVLIGKRVGVGDLFGRFAQGTSQISNLGGAFVGNLLPINGRY